MYQTISKHLNLLYLISTEHKTPTTVQSQDRKMFSSFSKYQFVPKTDIEKYHICFHFKDLQVNTLPNICSHKKHTGLYEAVKKTFFETICFISINCHVLTTAILNIIVKVTQIKIVLDHGTLFCIFVVISLHYIFLS